MVWLDTNHQYSLVSCILALRVLPGPRQGGAATAFALLQTAPIGVNKRPHHT